jgi:ribonucleotide reductase beta subunit family protein with ferritin-like domain
MGIEILSKHGCNYCEYAEQTCKSLNLEYTVKYVNKDELNTLCGTDESRVYPSVTTYPQIFVNGVYIGDYFAFQEYIDKSEPMLLPTMNRFTVFPIEHEHLWALYKKAQMSNWTAEEIDVSSDMEDWKSLSDNERHFIKYILAFFAGSDGIVFENINNNFADEVQYTEARSFYAYQCHNEMVHGETYSKLIDKYIRDEKEKKSLFEAINTISSIRDKAMWAMKWFDKSRPFSERLLAFACVEGIFFSGSFCAIFWLKKRGLLPGLCFSNELISRDEGMHLEFAIELFKLLKHKPSQAVVREIVSEAVNIEKSFILDALPCSLIGMNSDKMSDYIEYVSDRLLKQAGFDKIWNTQNPFDFMENISLDGKTNFFEKRVGDYGKIDENASTILFDEDF